MLPEDVTRMFNRRWLPILFGTVGSIVLVAIGIASIFSPEFISLLRGLFDSISTVIRQVMYYLLFPLGYLAAGLVYIVRCIVNLLRAGQPLEPFKLQEFAKSEGMPEAGEAKTLPEVVIVALKWTLFAVVSIIVIFLVAKAMRRHQSLKTKPDIDETNESL